MASRSSGASSPPPGGLTTRGLFFSTHGSIASPPSHEWQVSLSLFFLFPYQRLYLLHNSFRQSIVDGLVTTHSNPSRSYNCSPSSTYDLVICLPRRDSSQRCATVVELPHRRVPSPSRSGEAKFCHFDLVKPSSATFQISVILKPSSGHHPDLLQFRSTPVLIYSSSVQIYSCSDRHLFQIHSSSGHLLEANFSFPELALPIQVVAMKQSCWTNLPPELLRNVLVRIEESEAAWPKRKDVVACAGVCRNWREIMKELVKIPEFSQKLTFPISLKQHSFWRPPDHKLIFCTSASALYLHVHSRAGEKRRVSIGNRGWRTRRAPTTDAVKTGRGVQQKRQHKEKKGWSTRKY